MKRVRVMRPAPGLGRKQSIANVKEKLLEDVHVKDAKVARRHAHECEFSLLLLKKSCVKGDEEILAWKTPLVPGLLALVVYKYLSFTPQLLSSAFIHLCSKLKPTGIYLMIVLSKRPRHVS
jgi:hypothetical protein